LSPARWRRPERRTYITCSTLTTLDDGDETMKKVIVAAVLLVIIAFLTWLVWIETKVLLITLGLLILCLGAFYFVIRKM
jgi:hypothetical protein